MTSWNIIAQSSLMGLFIHSFTYLKTILQILLKPGRMCLVCMESRVESQFTVSSINSKLRITGCSLLKDVLKAYCNSIAGAPIQKAKRLNSNINFAGKGKQPCSIARN